MLIARLIKMPVNEQNKLIFPFTSVIYDLIKFQDASLIESTLAVYYHSLAFVYDKSVEQLFQYLTKEMPENLYRRALDSQINFLFSCCRRPILHNMQVGLIAQHAQFLLENAFKDREMGLEDKLRHFILNVLIFSLAGTVEHVASAWLTDLFTLINTILQDENFESLDKDNPDRKRFELALRIFVATSVSFDKNTIAQLRFGQSPCEGYFDELSLAKNNKYQNLIDTLACVYSPGKNLSWHKRVQYQIEIVTLFQSKHFPDVISAVNFSHNTKELDEVKDEESLGEYLLALIMNLEDGFVDDAGILPLGEVILACYDKAKTFRCYQEGVAKKLVDISICYVNLNRFICKASQESYYINVKKILNNLITPFRMLMESDIPVKSQAGLHQDLYLIMRSLMTLLINTRDKKLRGSFLSHALVLFSSITDFDAINSFVNALCVSDTGQPIYVELDDALMGELIACLLADPVLLKQQGANQGSDRVVQSKNEYQAIFSKIIDCFKPGEKRGYFYMKLLKYLNDNECQRRGGLKKKVPNKNQSADVFVDMMMRNLLNVLDIEQVKKFAVNFYIELTRYYHFLFNRAGLDKLPGWSVYYEVFKGDLVADCSDELDKCFDRFAKSWRSHLISIREPVARDIDKQNLINKKKNRDETKQNFKSAKERQNDEKISQRNKKNKKLITQSGCSKNDSKVQIKRKDNPNAEAERKAKAEAERKVKAEAERKAKAEAERKAKAKAKAEAERKVKAETERKARAEAERKAKAEAKRKAKAEAERKVKAEAERKAKAEAEAERKAKALLTRQIARKKAIRKAKRKAKEEADRNAKQEVGCKAKEEADSKAKAGAVRDAKKIKRLIANSKEKEEAGRQTKDEAVPNNVTQPKSKAKAETKPMAKAESKPMATVPSYNDHPFTRIATGNYDNFSLFDWYFARLNVPIIKDYELSRMATDFHYQSDLLATTNHAYAPDRFVFLKMAAVCYYQLAKRQSSIRGLSEKFKHYEYALLLLVDAYDELAWIELKVKVTYERCDIQMLGNFLWTLYCDLADQIDRSASSLNHSPLTPSPAQNGLDHQPTSVSSRVQSSGGFFHQRPAYSQASSPAPRLPAS